MAAKNEGSSSRSRENRRASLQAMEYLLAQLNHYSRRYKRGFKELLKKIEEDEGVEWELDVAMEEAKKILKSHIDQFIRLISQPHRINPAAIRGTTGEETQGAENRTKKVHPVISIVNMIQNLEIEAKAYQATVNEMKAAQVKEVLAAIEEVAESFDKYRKAYQEATRGKFEVYNQELEKMKDTLRGMSTSLSAFAHQLVA